MPNMINISELRAIANDLLTRVEREIGPNVPIDSPFYWELPSPEMRDMSKKITTVDLVGSLTDELEFLRSVENPLEDGPSSYLIYVASLLKYLGEKVVV
jgi:hypothetical protein